MTEDERDKRDNGYLTVEAALVFPIVLAVQLSAIYLFVFQYDRCLLDQDMARLVVLGCGAEEQEKEVLTEYLKGCAGELYLEKYVAWEMEAVEMELLQSDIRAEGKGRLVFPSFGWSIFGEEFVWDASATYGFKKLNPTAFIRQCRKWKGEK